MHTRLMHDTHGPLPRTLEATTNTLSTGQIKSGNNVMTFQLNKNDITVRTSKRANGMKTRHLQSPTATLRRRLQVTSSRPLHITTKATSRTTLVHRHPSHHHSSAASAAPATSMKRSNEQPEPRSQAQEKDCASATSEDSTFLQPGTLSQHATDQPRPREQPTNLS